MKEAARKDVEEKLVEEEPNKASMLDTLREAYESHKDLRCTRVVYIGRMASVAQRDIIKKLHSDFIKAQVGVRNITGSMLFINDTLFYHMIEVDGLDCLQSLFQDMMMEQNTDFFSFINSSGKDNKDASLINLSVRICCVSEDIVREFPIWSCREINAGGGSGSGGGGAVAAHDESGDAADQQQDDDAASEDQESLQTVLFETMKSMIEVGRHLCMKQDNDAAIKLFQSSQREIISRFPTADKIDFFMESKLLFDLKGFGEFFFKPINIHLQSEYTWPVEPMIPF